MKTLLIAILSVALILTGCQTTTPSQSFKVSVDPENPCANKKPDNNKELVIGTYGDYTNYFFYFSEQINTDISVYQESWGQHHQDITQNLKVCRQLADIEIVDAFVLQGLLNKNYFVDLTEKFAPLKNDILEFAVAFGQDTDKTQRAIPIDAGPAMMFYRRDLMQDLGFKPEQVLADWDSWIEYGKNLRDNHNRYLIDNVNDVVETIIYGSTQKNGYVYIDENNNILIEDERIKFAFNIAKILTDENLVANTGKWNDNWYKGFKQAQFATVVESFNLITQIESWIAPKTSGKWGASIIPNETYAQLSGGYAVIPKGNQKEDEAWKVIKYVLQANNQINAYLMFDELLFPTNIKTYEHDIFLSKNAFLGDQQFKKLVAHTAQNIKPLSTHKLDSIAKTLVIHTALQQVINGEATIDSALKQASEDLAKRIRFY